MEQVETPTPTEEVGFNALGLPARILKAVEALGYETPSPVQERCIPALMEGRDVLGQAQTGTGKTAAFALPLLARLNRKARKPQVLVLTPTRELAIQVAEAFERYAGGMPGFQVLPIYGGASYVPQLRGLQRGVHVVVGTPGRVMDHIRRGSLELDELRTLVLDEADEMLKMGFLEDVQWILEHVPAERQTALFSATMPPAVQRIAEDHLGDPEVIRIEARSRPADTIRQRVLRVHGPHKFEALTRVLELGEHDGMIVFVGTKNQAAEVAERLSIQGFAAAALSGDVNQANRERIVEKLKKGRLDLLVATDVAARGLDVDRISHVVNYDMPKDPEVYVHRIGRTGRAGRTGEAILFVKPREQHFLRALDRAAGQPMETMKLPTGDELTQMRVTRFRAQIEAAKDSGKLDFHRELAAEMLDGEDVDVLGLIAGLIKVAEGDSPLQVTQESQHQGRNSAIEWDEGENGRGRKPKKNVRNERFERGPRKDRGMKPPERGMDRFRIEVGYKHGVGPSSIVGAICNEAGLEGRHVGRIEIYDTHSTVDLPSGMPKEIFDSLKKTRVQNQPMRISRDRGPGKGGKRPMTNRERFEAGV